jgi:hypothetical protein
MDGALPERHLQSGQSQQSFYLPSIAGRTKSTEEHYDPCGEFFHVKSATFLHYNRNGDCDPSSNNLFLLGIDHAEKTPMEIVKTPRHEM